MKNILLKLDEEEFYKLSTLKNRMQLMNKKEITWEKCIMILKKKFEQS